MPDQLTTSAIVRALRKQGTALASERNRLADKLEDAHDGLHLAGGLIRDMQREIDRNRALITKLLKKCNQLRKAKP